MAVCNTSLFGDGNKYLKFQGGDLIAVDGQNTVERLVLSDLNLPYKQLVKFKTLLSANQRDFLVDQFNNNTTFFALVARYDPKSKIEDNNFLEWNWENNASVNTFSKILMMHTNTANPYTKIYLHNPNPTYEVQVDILVATSGTYSTTS
jgi:hypothetical protein